MVRRPGARVISTDLSAGMLATARLIDGRSSGPAPLLAQADATRLPFADGSFDIVFSAYGATPSSRTPPRSWRNWPGS